MKFLPLIENGKKTVGLVALFFSVLLLSSCLKNDDNDYTPEQSNLLVVNAYPEAMTDGILWAYNGSFVNSDAPIAYASNSRYYSGLYRGVEIAFLKASDKQTVLARGGAQGGNTSWSAFVTGKSDSSFIVKDGYTAPTAGKANIRFVQASRSSAKVDVLIGTEKTSGVAFSSGTDPQFKEFTVDGTSELLVSVFAADGTTALVTRSFIPKSGKTYTLYLYGSKTATGPKGLGLGIIDHDAANAKPSAE